MLRLSAMRNECQFVSVRSQRSQRWDWGLTQCLFITENQHVEELDTSLLSMSSLVGDILQINHTDIAENILSVDDLNTIVLSSKSILHVCDIICFYCKCAFWCE